MDRVVKQLYKDNLDSLLSPIVGSLVGHHNIDILTNRLTAVIDMSLPVITAVNHNHLVYQMVTVITGHNRLPWLLVTGYDR